MGLREEGRRSARDRESAVGCTYRSIRRRRARALCDVDHKGVLLAIPPSPDSLDALGILLDVTSQTQPLSPHSRVTRKPSSSFSTSCHGFPFPISAIEVAIWTRKLLRVSSVSS